MAADSLVTIPVDGALIACRRVGSGPPLLILNGFAATGSDWDPSFIDRLASTNELVLIDNRGIGDSTDNGASFDISQLADDTARVIECWASCAQTSWDGRWADSSRRRLRCYVPIALKSSSSYQPIQEEVTPISPRPACGRN